MGAPTNVLTPQVAGLHWDDLTQLFRLKITFLLDTPLGNFEREVVLEAGDLASIVQQLVAIWSGAAPTTGATAIAAPAGDLAALAGVLSTMVPMVYVAATIPTPPTADPTTDPTWGTYVGTTDTGAGAAWGGTSP